MPDPAWTLLSLAILVLSLWLLRRLHGPARQ
jgi:hypothetical protein